MLEDVARNEEIVSSAKLRRHGGDVEPGLGVKEGVAVGELLRQPRGVAFRVREADAGDVRALRQIGKRDAPSEKSPPQMLQRNAIAAPVSRTLSALPYRARSSRKLRLHFIPAA